MSITKYHKIIEQCSAKNAKLVVVSKMRTIEQVMPFYNEGQRAFAENRVQNLLEKQAEMPKDIEWHLIGHLQRNKVKYIAPFIALIHSVDSFKLLKEINKEAKKNDRILPCLFQFHIAEEESKYGLNMDKAIEIIKNEQFISLKNIEIHGVMGMATFTDDKDKVRKEFKSLKMIFDELKTNYFKDNNKFKTISMGMSGDFDIALEEGSNMLRVGSILFE